MKIHQDDDGDYWSYPIHMVGSITTLPPEQESDVVRLLHDVVEEVTGKPVYAQEKQRIGFLP